MNLTDRTVSGSFDANKVFSFSPFPNSLTTPRLPPSLFLRSSSLPSAYRYLSHVRSQRSHFLFYTARHDNRAALAAYDDSDGKVLLLAAVHDTHNNASSYAENSGGGMGGGSGGTGSAGVGGSYYCTNHHYHHHHQPQNQHHHVAVEVFPGEEFRFTEDCHVLVMAEAKLTAEDVIFDLQVRIGIVVFAVG